MRLGEVLASVDGLNKRFVHYLEAQGYIHPAKIPKARIAHRNYSPEDLRVIRDVWRYYRRGFSLQAAYDLAMAADRSIAFLFLHTPTRGLRRTLDLLEADRRVAEAAGIYGDDSEIIAQVRVAEENEVYDVLASLYRNDGVVGVSHVVRVTGQPMLRRPVDPCSPERSDDSVMRAYVLIRVPAKQIGWVVERLQAFPSIVEASAVYGETDIIARVETADQAELDDLVVNQIQAIPAVDSTRTFITITGTYWSRSATADRSDTSSIPEETQRRV